MKQILVVDDEPRIAEIVGDYLERAGFAVMTAAKMIPVASPATQ